MAQALAEKFEQAGPAEKERVASVLQSEQLAITCQKEKEQRHLFRSPNSEMGENQGE